MFGVLSDMMHLATRIPPAGRGDVGKWDAPEHWKARPSEAKDKEKRP